MPKNNREAAESGAVHRTIPKLVTDVAVTASSGVQDLKAFAGQWIYLRAIGGDITLRLGTAIANAGEGLVIATTDGLQEFFVDPGDTLALHHRAAGAATLRILSD